MYPDSPRSASDRKNFKPVKRRDHCTVDVYGSTTNPVFPGIRETSDSNARATASACRQKNIPAPIGTENHLCASQVTESASDIPARWTLRRGEIAAAPPHAAST